MLGLPAHQAGDPQVVVLLGVFQGLDLVHLAAQIGISAPHLFVLGDLVLALVGAQVDDVQVEALDQVFLVLQGFLEVVAGVDEVNLLLRADRGNDVQEIGGRGRERGRHHDLVRGEILIDTADTRLEVQLPVFPVEVIDGVAGQTGAVVADPCDQLRVTHGVPFLLS